MFYIIGFIYVLTLLLNIRKLKKTTRIPISKAAILSLAILIPLTPVVFFLLPFFGVYRLIIKIILSIKHGKDFYGFLSGADTFHGVDKPSKCIISSCIMIRCKKYTSEEFYEICKDIFSKTSALKKFRALLYKSYGYSYLIHEEIDLLKDCMSKMKTLDCPGNRIDKQQFYELLNYHCNSPMPKNGKIPFCVLIGTQPINWRDDGYDYYPVMFRAHHAIADGISLLKTLVAAVADKLEVSKEPINPLKSPKQKKSGLFVYKQVKKFMEVIGMVKILFLIHLFYPSLVVSYFTYKANDTNTLHTHTSLTHQKVIGISSEQSAKYVGKIKKIKQQLPGTAFPTILLAAISASFSDYFEKNCFEPPQYITLAIPMVEDAAELRYLTPGNVTINDIDLTNSHSFISLRVPISIQNGDKSEFPANKQVINRLKLINQEVDIVKNSLEYQSNHYFMHAVCVVLPEYFLKMYLDIIHCTTIVSILVAPPKLTYYNRQLEMVDIHFWIPYINNIGTTIGIITYDDRLHIGLSADKALIPDQNDVQRIADDIYKYLDVLEKEVEENRKGNPYDF